MEKSESINELAKALCAAQGELENVTKDKQGYGYKYADLAQVLSTIKSVFVNHKLSFCQLPSFSEGQIFVQTILMHESGQWLSGTIGSPLFTKKSKDGKDVPLDVQAVGSAITYLRRYALVSLAGIHQEDDDAQSLSNRHVEPVAPEKGKNELLVDLRRVIQDKALSADVVNGLLEQAKVSDFDELPAERLVKLIAYLNK